MPPRTGRNAMITPGVSNYKKFVHAGAELQMSRVMTGLLQTICLGRL